MKPPSYQETLAAFFNPKNPRIGCFADMPQSEYRIAAGIAPSDLKQASEDIGPRSKKGHLTHLANDRLARWYEAEGLPLPPGLEGTSGSKNFELGTVYHALLLQPHQFQDDFAVLTPDMEAELVAIAKERKADKAPKKYSGILKEAKAWKIANPGKDPDESQKDSILQDARTRFVDDVKFHSRLTEYTEWIAKQKDAGRQIVDSKSVDHAERMLDALYSHKENEQVGEFVKSLNINPDNTERSLFAVADFGKDHPSIQIKGRPDVLPLGNAIIDPKTALCAHPDSFAYACETFHYDLSMAFYCILTELLQDHESAAGLDFPKTRVGFLVHCKTPPYYARLYYLPDDWLKCARREVMAELGKISRMWKHGSWSGDMMATQIGELLPSPWKQSEIEASV